MRVIHSGLNATTIDQAGYAHELLQNEGMENCRGVMTPLILPKKLRNVEDEDTGETNETDCQEKYRSTMGSLLYLANGTRPDLSFVCSYLSQLNHCAKKENMNDQRHVLRYLKSTCDLKLCYEKTGKSVQVYSDANWGNDSVDSKSFSGFVFVLAGGAVIWQTRKQQTVALSTVEAEYVATTEAIREIIWVGNFLREVRCDEYLMKPSEILVDNQGAISLANNVILSDRIKHIVRIFSYMKDVINRKVVILRYVSSGENLADIFTKVLSGPKTKEVIAKLDLINCSRFIVSNLI